MNANTGTFAIALLASALATVAWAQDLGRVHFQTSCTPQAQEKFDRGLALVHSFFYPDSVQAFTEAAAADPKCAIAYWGIAVSHRPNPLVVPHPTSVLKNGLDAVEKLRPLVPEGATLAQLALRWILMHDAVSTVIPGARSAEQAQANAAGGRAFSMI